MSWSTTVLLQVLELHIKTPLITYGVYDVWDVPLSDTQGRRAISHSVYIKHEFKFSLFKILIQLQLLSKLYMNLFQGEQE